MDYPKVDYGLALVILGQIFFTAFLLFLVAAFLRDRSRQRGELQMRLLDRFSSAPELLAYLDSEAGRTLREALTGRRFVAVRQVLGALQLGIVLVALGGGLFLAAVRTGDSDLWVAAAVCAAVGVGLLAAALVSKQLSVRWKLWTDDSPVGRR